MLRMLRISIHSICLLVIQVHVCSHSLMLGRIPGHISTEVLYSAQRYNPPCVASCRGVSDGNYPSCFGCTSFATCSNERLLDNRPCVSFGGLYWDDELKLCTWSPDKCYRHIVDDVIDEPDDVCVSDCRNVPNGDYQSCFSCNAYVTCSEGYTFDLRPCPWILVWDDVRKMCSWTSKTCDSKLGDLVEDLL